MTILRIVFVAYMMISTEAAQCPKGHHCDECDSYTSHCNTECKTGYFDLRCSSKCNSNCKENKCKSSQTGTEVCVEGCVPGYRGSGCTIPCYKPNSSCTACPAGCEGGYCQIGTKCVSECVDFYYGTGCKNCSERCKYCNRIRGICYECHPQYFGLNCQYACRRCKTTCKYGCVHGCLPGFYGTDCEKNCSENCRINTSNTVDNLPSVTDTSVCNQDTGDCIHKCKDGWFGSQCFSQCNPSCENRRCDDRGYCVDGCIPHHFGKHCKSCPNNCCYRTCHNNTGTCVGGCLKGFYGETCYKACDDCLQGFCDQVSGICIKGCPKTQRRCRNDCQNNCTIHDCLKESKGDGQSDTSHIEVGLAGLALPLVVIVGLLTALLCHCKRSRGDRGYQAQGPLHSTETEQVRVSVGYEPLRRYWEIREEAMIIPRELPPNQDDPEQGPSVLAEYFPTAADISVYCSDAGQCSAGDTQSHPHQAQDVADSDSDTSQSSAEETPSYSLQTPAERESDHDASQDSAGDTQTYTIVNYMSPVSE